MKKLVLVLALLLSPFSLFAQTPEELIANRNPVGAHLGHGSENPYWASPAVRARLNEIAVEVLTRVTNDPAYLPSTAERNLLSVWWTRDGYTQRMSDASLEVVKRAKDLEAGFASAHIRRWVATPADYAALKANGFTVHGIELLPEFPQTVANLATKFGDYAYIDQMDRSEIFRWPYTAADYKAWLRWKSPQLPTDQARYELLQSEITLVGLSPADAQQKEILTFLQQASDLYFQRIRRAQLLGQ